MQAFEAEVRQQLKRPQGLVEAQAAAAQAEWDWAQSNDTFDHKLVTVFDETRSAGTKKRGSTSMDGHACTICSSAHPPIRITKSWVTTSLVG